MRSTLQTATLACVLLGACTVPPWGEQPMGDDAGSLLDAGVQPRDAGIADAGPPPDAAPGSERCDNGFDDDGDGDIDCADADCGDFACVPAPPDEWTIGRLLEFEGETPSCPEGDVVLAGWTTVRADPATCSACECGQAPNTATCSVDVVGASDAACGAGVEVVNVGSTCVAHPRSFRSVASITPRFDWTCDPPTGGELTDRPPASLGRGLALCGSEDARGCDSASRCVPEIDAQLPACIYREGERTCPEDFPAQRVVFTETAESRDCGECSCTPNAAQCGGLLRVYQLGACEGMRDTFPIGLAECRPSTASPLLDTGLIVENPSIENPRCDPTTAQPIGCAAPGPTATVCCQAGPLPSGCPGTAGAPMHHVATSDAGGFCIDVREVTNTDYAAFLEAGVDRASHRLCGDEDIDTPEDWPPNDDELGDPVLRVTFCEAAAYCEWAGKRLCGPRRGDARDHSVLDEENPDASEWTFICAQGAQGSALCDDNPVLPPRSRPCCHADVVFDLAGNAREWVDACDGQRCAQHDNEDCFDLNDRRIDETQGRTGFRCCADPI